MSNLITAIYSFDTSIDIKNIFHLLTLKIKWAMSSEYVSSQIIFFTSIVMLIYARKVPNHHLQQTSRF